MSENTTIVILPKHKKGNTFPGHDFYALNEDLTPYDLTGCAIKSSFKYGSSDGEIVQTFSLVSGFTMIDAVAGHYSLDEQIINWTPGKYYYDIQITKADAKVDKPIAGTWTITKDITPTT